MPTLRSLFVPVLSLALLLAARIAAGQTTELDRYVAQPDPAYSYRLVRSLPGLGYRAHVLEMTSQTWRAAAEVDRPQWRHWLTVVVPSAVRTPTGLLLISGGSNDDAAPSLTDVVLTGTAAAAAGAVVAELRQEPNQPLLFLDESRRRSEDALIAYTWDKYLRTGDATWPAQLPMTKAAVRAMDAVTAFARGPEAGGHTVDRFVVTGASKRGWTTWLTAAVDRRVVGIIPLVFDVLNVEPSFLHHWRAYGFWAPAVRDYEEAGVMAWLGTPPTRSLLDLVDPHSYRARYTIPKYLVNASGDEFFLPDSSRFYFDDLPGEKYLRYVPNNSHGLDNPDVITGILAFFQLIAGARARPRFSWEALPDSGIRLRAQDTPVEVRLWQATNSNARDFRVETAGRIWTSSRLSESSAGVYEARLGPPARGWSAFFLELTFAEDLLPLKFTTPVRVVPDTLPYPPPSGVVSAANYLPLTAAEAIASAFGQGLSGTTAQAVQLPLPESLAGVSVRVVDSGGGTRPAPLFFVSPGQVNFLIPPGAARGLARVEMVRDGQVVAKGQTLIEEFAPALFSANGDGRGVAAALAVTVQADGSQTVRLVFDSAPPGQRTSVPVDLRDASSQVYLSLFGTGMRNAAGAAQATIGGAPVAVSGPVPHPQFVGLDQVNLGPLPRTLAGRGEVDVRLTIGGRASNVVTVRIQ